MSDRLVVIRLVGLATGEPSPADGKYVAEYDPSRAVITTSDIDRAQKMSSEEAWELWRSVDPDEPVRPDGKPNRPLTAFTIEMAPAP